MNIVRTLFIAFMSCSLFAVASEAQEFTKYQQQLINQHAEAVTELICSTTPADDNAMLFSCEGGGRCIVDVLPGGRTNCNSCARFGHVVKTGELNT